MGHCQLARDFAVTDWLTVIYRYFGGNPAEGSDFISNGFVASAIFILYTRKINLIFSDFHNRIFDFDIAALDMMNLQWPYSFPPITNQLSFCYVPHLYIVGTKLIREATSKNHMYGSRRGIPISRIGLEPPWSQLNSERIKRL